MFTRSMRAAAVVCAATFTLLSGCGKCAKECAAPRRAYAPLAPQGTLAAYVYETKGLADNPMMQFLADYNAANSAKSLDFLREIGADVPELGDLWENVDIDALKAKELENLRKVDWVAFTMAAPAFKADDLDGDSPLPFPSAALVYCFAKPVTMAELEQSIKKDFEGNGASLDKEALASLRELFTENFTVSDDTVAGIPIKKFTVKATEATEEIVKRLQDLEPCYGLYGETLFILASSPKAFAETVALYDGKAATTTDTSLAADLELGKGLPQLRYGLYGLASFLQGFLSASDFDKMCSAEQGKFVKALKNLRITGSIDGEAMSTIATIGVTFGDEPLASEMVSLIDSARGLVYMLAGAVTMQVPAAMPLVNIFNKGAVTAEGATSLLSFTVTKSDIEAIDLAALFTQVKALQDGADDDEDENDDEDEDDDKEEDDEE